MATCSTCDSLAAEVAIRSPQALQDVAASVVPYIDDGRLAHLSGESDLRELARGRWDDLVSATLRCTACGTLYALFAETYHGSGGYWRRAACTEP